MNKKVECVTRYQVPSNQEPAPYATFCKVINNYSTNGKETETIYVQTSQDEDHPFWVSIGDFLTESFGDLIFDKLFIYTCLKLFNDKSYKIKIKKKDENN